MVLLKVSPWKGAVRFGKCGKLSPRYIRPFKILARVGPIAYTLELPKELKGIHSMFPVSNLKKCLVEGDIVVPIDEIQLDDKFHMIEVPLEVVDREVKRLKQSQIPIVKVRWNSQKGPEFTWERKDQIKKKYHHLFTSNDGVTKDEGNDGVEVSTSDPPIPKRPIEKHLKEVKRIFRYLRGTINMGLWYPKDSGFELTAFSDADHAGCIDTRKSTSGGIQFLGDKLVSWMSKKQDCTAMSLAKAEYVVLSACCAQVMWMRTQLKDYGFNYNKIPLYCDSQSAIAISCNLVLHSHTKHIHTRYHFIKEQVRNGIIELYFVRTEYQLADMFTKALPEERFQYLVRRIGMRCLTPAELEVLANEST
ncbi:hypothetical protein Tco_0976579 [Tanacetum coccineum]|uniref:Tf2-1-like SH3-like domain-containing protein n=1 Tax=Tanacetum coccineum TaxID=301880 RepID=A0ABQ5EI31_9ASTR